MKRLVVLFWLVLAAFIANSVAGFVCYRVHHAKFRGGPSPQENYTGAVAASLGWPVRPPAAWPQPTQWTAFRELGYRHYSIYSSSNNQAGFQMTVGRYGWPAPVFEHAQFWWPWNDPQWKTNVPDDSGLGIYWLGFLIVPLAVALLIWLMIPVPGMIRSRIRRESGRCAGCGYPAGPFRVCPECGRPTDGISHRQGEQT